jgi:hypothetical protein
VSRCAAILCLAALLSACSAQMTGSAKAPGYNGKLNKAALFYLDNRRELACTAMVVQDSGLPTSSVRYSDRRVDCARDPRALQKLSAAQATLTQAMSDNLPEIMVASGIDVRWTVIAPHEVVSPVVSTHYFSLVPPSELEGRNALLIYPREFLLECDANACTATVTLETDMVDLKLREVVWASRVSVRESSAVLTKDGVFDAEAVANFWKLVSEKLKTDDLLGPEPVQRSLVLRSPASL